MFEEQRKMDNGRLKASASASNPDESSPSPLNAIQPSSASEKSETLENDQVISKNGAGSTQFPWKPDERQKAVESEMRQDLDFGDRGSSPPVAKRARSNANTVLSAKSTS